MNVIEFPVDCKIRAVYADMKLLFTFHYANSDCEMKFRFQYLHLGSIGNTNMPRTEDHGVL